MKVIQNVFWGVEVPQLPSAYDTKVKSNLEQFCRTILAAAEESVDNSQPVKESKFSVSTFCSNILELGKLQPATKKQRITGASEELKLSGN